MMFALTGWKTVEINGIESVSYTHLDVYKRQEPELGNMHKAALLVRNKRKSYGILPVVTQIDTLAAEYPACLLYTSRGTAFCRRTLYGTPALQYHRKEWHSVCAPIPAT